MEHSEISPTASLEKNRKLKKLVISALDYAKGELGRESKLTPFILTEHGTFTSKLEGLSASIKAAEFDIAGMQAEKIALYCYAGTVEAPDGHGSAFPLRDAIIVRAFDRKEKNGILVIQMYQHKTRNRAFSLLGSPLMEYIPNLMKID